MNKVLANENFVVKYLVFIYTMNTFENEVGVPRAKEIL